MKLLPKLSLVQKLITSLMISGICMTGALVYAVHGLETMHRMEVEIARNDLAAATDAIILREAMVTRQRNLGKYLILHEEEFADLYRQATVEFREVLQRLNAIYDGHLPQPLLADIKAFDALGDQALGSNGASLLEINTAADRIVHRIEQLRSDVQKSLVGKLKESDLKEAETVTWSIGLSLFGVTVSLGIGILIIYTFASSIGKLQRATHRIAAGEFDHDPGIAEGDEIGELAKDFTHMAARLKELEQLSLDASPLTRLPGNIAIERCINRRLRERLSFAMCYLDLDNFKSYNDHYGYIKASELIKRAGEVIYDAVRLLDDKDAFVGHIGGDDFVVIIDSEHAEQACRSIIAGIDALVPEFYSPEDRAVGHIDGVDRYGVPRKFPLISLSIAALICEPGMYGNAAEIATAAAEVKDHVKESAGSNYIIVREAVLT